LAALRLAVLISGRGSNMLAIARACDSRQVNARIVRVLCNEPAAAGLASAAAMDLPCAVINDRDFPDRRDFDSALRAEIDGAQAEIVALAGFMRILGPQFVTHYRGRLLNIHPSLLPKYRGLHTHRRVLEARERWHGATVHYVTQELDGGPAVLQGRVPVRDDDNIESLSARVQACEHIIYPRVVGWIASGRLTCPQGEPQFHGAPLCEPIVEEFTGD
jgi:phosphoribosylglycinamide formyltransferase-1